MNIKKLSGFTLLRQRLRRIKVVSPAFTIVEILIIAPIVILVIGIFVSAIVSMTGEVLVTRASNALAYKTQDALNLIQQDVKLSNAYLATNSVSLVSPQGYDNGTENFKNASATNGAMLILDTYATTSNPLTSTRDLVYLADEPNACNSAQVNQNTPLMINIVYFVKDNTLWRRIVMPSDYATIGCVNGSAGVPWQQPSCAPAVSDVFCKTQDMRLVDGISSDGFSISYYPSSSSINADTVASDNTKSDAERLVALQANNTVSVTLNAINTVAGREISQSNTIRAVSANNVVEPVTYTLTTIAGTGGTVSAGGTYNSGSSQTIIATPNASYNFVSWSGSTGCSGIASHTITMDEDKTCTANFTYSGDVLYYLKTLAAGDTTIATTYANIDLEMDVKTGDQTISTNTSWGNATADTRMLGVRVEGNLTIDAGVTLTATTRKRGMAIYVTGDLILNGTISMTARGATAAGQQVLLLNDGTEYQVAAVGGAGGARATCGSGGEESWPAGTAGATGATGGGGSGRTRCPPSTSWGTGGGSAGTSYSGGSGGGGSGDNWGVQATINGGLGGAGGYPNGGGGAGNPAGASYQGTAENGTGGLLAMYITGNLTFGTNGLVTVNGSAGAYAPTGYHGGGSGGGSANVFYKGTATDYLTTKITATGGTGWSVGGTGTTRFFQSAAL